MIPNMLRMNWWEYHFQAQWDSSWWNSFMEFYYDSLMRWDSHDKVIFKVQWSTYKEAENKMIAVLQNAWILPKPEVKRSVLQNCLYWKWMEVVSEETGNNKDVVHALMKKRFLSKRKLVKLGWKRNYVNIEGSTKELSVKRFTKFLDDIYVFFAERDLKLPTEDQLDMNSLINTYWNM
jgi:hypothetical protein